MSEPELKNFLKQNRENVIRVLKLKEIPQRTVMPQPLVAFENRGIFKYCRPNVLKKLKDDTIQAKSQGSLVATSEIL